MSVWLTIPSARPAAEANPVLEKWRAQGYKIALFTDHDEPSKIHDMRTDADSYLLNGELAFKGYPGYAAAVNHMVAAVMMYDPDAEWFVAGGDDTEPDPNHTADEIAAQCSLHFHGRQCDALKDVCDSRMTFGVMQPTGDRFAGGQIDRICGSPWLGRDWCKRINHGRGPLWPEYFHMWADEEVQHVATKYGVLWQRPDLIHLHHHFMRESDAINSNAVAFQTPEGMRYGGEKKPRPAFLDEANSREHWMKYEKLFKDRRDAVPSFPGSEPL